MPDHISVSSTSPPPASGISQQVLVVDDDPIKRYTTTRILERGGFDVVQATDGREALERVQEKPGIVVLDVKLPDIDGFDVCRRIKADPATADIPVLHLSAHRTSGHDLAHGLEGGADSYLTVPVDPEVLVASVRALMRLHRAEAEARTAAHYWSATFDAIRDAIFLVDSQGRVVRSNQAATTLLGEAPTDSVLGKSLESVYERLGIAGMAEPPESAATAGGTPLPVEVEARGGRWLRVTWDPVQDATGLVGTVCTLADITERVEAEQDRQRLAARNERIAETLQRSLLLTPSPAAFPGVDVESIYEAAWDESLIGGDFTDIFALGEDQIALVIGDVTGKGLTAATFTAEIKFALRAFLREAEEPGHTLSRLNRYLWESRLWEPHPVQTFVSLTLAILNTVTGEVSCSSAGAEPPLIVRQNEGTVEEIETGGLLLAMDEQALYEEGRAHLERGDLFLLATDGITEARTGRRGQFFGIAGLGEAARAAMFLPTLRDTAESIVKSALAFAGGKQQDDICLLVARRRSEE